MAFRLRQLRSYAGRINRLPVNDLEAHLELLHNALRYLARDSGIANQDAAEQIIHASKTKHLEYLRAR